MSDPPAAGSPPRPRGPIPGSYWVVPGKLAAGEYPGHPDPRGAREKLSLLRGAGIEFFVDLTEAGEYGLEPYEPYLDGARHVRYGVRDLGVPPVETMQAILAAIDASIEQGRAVYVHCYAGVGRTGTVVGCHLVRHGSSAGEALAAIAEWRRATPNAHRESPETREQRRFVAEWEARGETPATIGRKELVERLAEVSHRTWMRQKVRDQGADPAAVGAEVTDHDRERAEDAVRELERLRIWPPRPG